MSAVTDIIILAIRDVISCVTVTWRLPETTGENSDCTNTTDWPV